MTSNPANKEAILAILDDWFKERDSTDLTYMASFAPEGYGQEKGERMRWHLACHIAKRLENDPQTTAKP